MCSALALRLRPTWWFLCLGLCLVAASPLVVKAETALPPGLDSARWGMTVDELGKVVSIRKIDLNAPFSYSDHREEEPDVYAGEGHDGQRVEYYFYGGKLYKTYLFHGSNQQDLVLYQQLAEHLVKAYGQAYRRYDEVVMGMQIVHTIWQDETTAIDLRYGGGFVFQVHTDRARAASKANALKRKKSI